MGLTTTLGPFVVLSVLAAAAVDPPVPPAPPEVAENGPPPTALPVAPVTVTAPTAPPATATSVAAPPTTSAPITAPFAGHGAPFFAQRRDGAAGQSGHRDTRHHHAGDRDGAAGDRAADPRARRWAGGAGALRDGRRDERRATDRGRGRRRWTGRGSSGSAGLPALRLRQGVSPAARVS